jgi:signal transduction histidine kinase
MHRVLELFSTQAFMPHGHCYLWQPALVWLQVISNSAIGLAYLLISGTLAYLVYRVRNLPFRFVYLAFGLFIVSCGVTHFMDVLTIWQPRYWLDGALRAFTAVASVGTALLLPMLVPQVVSLVRGASAAHTFFREELPSREGNLESLTHEVASRHRELKAVQGSLQKARDEAVQVSELRTNFLSLVSHELRTPLTSMRLQLDRLSREGSVGSNEKANQLISKIGLSSRRLEELVNSLLEYARIQSGKIELRAEWVPVATLMTEIVEELRPQAEQKQLDLRLASLSHDLKVQADPRMMRLVLTNLVSNALKYTDKGSVAVMAHLEAGMLEMVVTDTGPGIPKEAHALIFEPFEQLDTPQHRQMPGVGLGLALIRQMAHAMGGHVALTSEVGRGSTFKVTLPVESRPSASEATL